jgi:diaminopimelate epimerase
MNTRTPQPAGLPFMKMHGLGNDFVVIDERETGPVVTEALSRAMGDRHRGVGFDQLAVIRSHPQADLELLFWNSDGSMSAACGNATRCVAGHEFACNPGKETLSIVTERGQLQAWNAGNGLIRVNMGAPFLNWAEIPLAGAMDTLALPIEGAPTATGMGNPHCTYFVEDIEAADLYAIGAATEHHPLFPQRTNVQLAQMIGPNRLRVRVWERGVGVTEASGSSSCAAGVAAIRRGLAKGRIEVVLDGGTLFIDWTEDGVLMEGPWAHVFDGIWRGAE